MLLILILMDEVLVDMLVEIWLLLVLTPTILVLMLLILMLIDEVFVDMLAEI